MKAWSLEELALLWRHSNAEVAEITGRSIEEVGDKLLNMLGDDPWYAKWPSVPNHHYQYLERIIDAVRGGILELERAA